jgi:hypothetical protein
MPAKLQRPAEFDEFFLQMAKIPGSNQHARTAAYVAYAARVRMNVEVIKTFVREGMRI